MRTAAICPTCATYINAACIIYDGSYLTNTKIAPLDPLDIILGKIDSNLVPLIGIGNPTSIPVYKGQLYLDTSVPKLWIGLGTTSPNWGTIATIITTTTTTTSTTSTTTTVPSDIRLKANIRLTGRKIGKFNEYMWEWNNIAKSLGYSKYRNVGVLAQDIIRINPSLVETNKYGFYIVNYNLL